MKLSENIRGVHHVAVLAYEGGKSSRWYQEKLGFGLIQKKIAVMNGKTEFFLLRKGNLVVELVQPHGRLREEVKKKKEGVLDHYAMEVPDLEQQAEKALKEGILLHESTSEGMKEYPYLGKSGVKGINFKGPEGEVIEFCRDESKDYGEKRGLTGWAHLAVKVRNLTQSEEFYRKLGFQRVGDGYLPTEEGRIEIVFLEHRGYQLELIQMNGNESFKEDGIIDHFALEVENIQEAFEEARREKLPLCDYVIRELPLMEKGVRFFFVKGPDGEKVEFIANV